MSENRITEAYAITTFCDDVRNEVDGIVSIVGARPALVLPMFPFVIPKLGFHIQIVAPPLPMGEHELTALIYMPGDNIDAATFQLPGTMRVLEEPSAQPRDADIPAHSKIVQQFVVSPLQIMQEGHIRVRIKLAKFPIIKAGVLRVQGLQEVTLPKVSFEFGGLQSPVPPSL